MRIKVITSYTLLFLLLLVQAGIGQRPRIGLALSGGGARGFAHIGTLKLLDELQIPVDYIAGTSIGAIVGGLYASGYTAREIEEIAHKENWSEFFTDRPPRTTLPYLHKKDDGKYHLEFGLKGITPIIPGGLIGGQKISLMLSNLTASTNVYSSFDDLPIPFRCVAVDLLSGRDVVLGKGPLAKALRSSMSIPTVFSPVEWGDSLLIDGGVLNNFPADVVKDMGADIIIGVNVGQPLKGKDDLGSLISILDQTMILTDYERQQANSALCDILVLPELRGFPPIDFNPENIRQIMSRGDDAAEGVREELQHLKNRFIDDILVYAHSDSVLLINPIIQNFAVSGNVSFPPEYFRDYLGCKPGNRLDRELVEMNLDRLRASGRYDKIAYEVVPVHENNVRIILTINERRQPVIFGVSIIGQQKLPYMFIYNLLGIKPSQMFDKDLLNERINDMYSLGYFETIEYTIVPVNENAIRLVFHIREKPLRKLRLGFRYDDEYKTVGIIGIQATNVPLPGFMIESSVEFSGLLRFEYTLAYPSRRLNLPVFPFIRLRYKDIPYNLYDQISGNKIAQYDDRGYTAGGGLGVLFADTGILELEFHQEEVDINPELASLDPEFFPSWKDRLRKLRILMRIDLLDDPVIPRRGDLWNLVSDLSLRDLNSDLDYQQIELQWDTYKTPFRKHTVHLQAYGTTYWNDLPGYKFPFKGGPHNVVGLKYNQIEGNKFGYLRFDYRFQYRRDVFFKLIYNAGIFRGNPDFGFDGTKLFYGYGLGLKFLSIIGPFELIAGRGSQSMRNNTRMHTNIYFSQGLVF